MQLTIKSKDGAVITFSRPGSQYIYADINGQPGMLGCQICDGGHTMGSTIGYKGNDPQAFKRICRGWYRAMRYRKNK